MRVFRRLTKESEHEAHSTRFDGDRFSGDVRRIGRAQAGAGDGGGARGAEQDLDRLQDLAADDCEAGFCARRPALWAGQSTVGHPEAKEAYRTRKRFAAGTVIVKEKLQEETSKSHEGLGIMIKQTAGTSAATGDWKYAYLDIDGRVLLGKSVEHCARCHLRAPNDSVFGPR
jgi:hypothetical protein